MLQCPNCQGRFFRVLETRLHLPPHVSLSMLQKAWQKTQPVLSQADREAIGLLSKRRCKRCKYKYFFNKNWASGQVQQTSFEVWQAAQKLSKAMQELFGLSSGTGSSAKTVAGQYSNRVRRGAEAALEYLNARQQAKASPSSNEDCGDHVA